MEQDAPPAEGTALPEQSAPAPTAQAHDARRSAFLGALRWTGALIVALFTAVALLPWLPTSLKRDLAHGKPWRASSTFAECHPETMTCGNGRTSIFFHTRDEPQPWVEFDLGQGTTIREVVVRNRRDGDRFVLDRAVPLVLEVSDDATTWRTVAEQNAPFSDWTARFEPTAARYVRLRSPRTTMLHLEAVEVYQ